MQHKIVLRIKKIKTIYLTEHVGLNIFLFGNIYRYKDNTHI